MEDRYEFEMNEQFTEAEKLHETIKQLDLKLHPSKIYAKKRDGPTSAEMRKALKDKKM
jgi:hypothetical protein